MKESKSEKILDAASYLFSSKGYAQTSIKEISEYVGIHKSTIFHYFKNKEEILSDILKNSAYSATNNLKQSLLSNRNKDPVERLRLAIYAHVKSIDFHLNDVKVYLKEVDSLSDENKALYLEYRKRYQNDIEEIIKDVQKTGIFKGMNSKIVAFGILGMWNWLSVWYNKEGPFDPEIIADTFFKMLISDDHNRQQ